MSGFIQYLNREFDDRKARNGAYSVRAFAKLLQISPASLSLYLRAQSPVPLNTAEKLGRQLGLSSRDVRGFYFDDSVPEKAKSQSTNHSLSTEEFRLISDPLHFAILGLAHLPGNQSEVSWLADMLNASESDVREAYKRLKKLELVEEHDNGGFRQTTKPLVTTQDVPNVAIRNYHRRTLRAADHALDASAVSQREFSASTFAITPSQLPKAKQLLRRFREEMQALAKGKSPSRIYTLAIQFFPVSKDLEEQ